MPTGIGLGLSAITAIYGGIEGAQAKKAALNNLNNRPQWQPLPEDDNQLNLAESQANQGMGAGARQTLLNNSQNNTSAVTEAALMGGGDANTSANIVDKSQQQLNNLATYDDQARQSHLQTLMGTYNQYANQRQANADKEFQINKYAPWADRQQLYGQQMQSGQNLLMSGLNTFGKGLMGLGGSGGDNGNNGGSSFGGGGNSGGGLGGGSYDSSGYTGGNYGAGQGGYVFGSSVPVPSQNPPAIIPYL